MVREENPADHPGSWKKGEQELDKITRRITKTFLHRQSTILRFKIEQMN